MKGADLDRLHRDRINPIQRGWSKGDRHVSVDDIFVSKRVIDSIDSQKAWLASFRSHRVLPIIPFVPHLYVTTCPACVQPGDFELFSGLAKAGLIVPVLTGAYRFYPEHMVELLSGLDHISWHEFDFYRHVALNTLSPRFLCGHCVKEREDNLATKLSGMKNAREIKDKIHELLVNLSPFLHPDYELIDELERAVINKDRHHLNQLLALSQAISTARTAQAYSAALVIKDQELRDVPTVHSSAANDARQTAFMLGQIVGEGLGLKVPADIPVDTYVELVKDFRPRILAITKEVTEDASSDDEISMKKLLTAIADINREIERIKGLRRHLLLEAVVGFAKRNPALTTSALVAGTLGLGGSILGCAGVPVAAAVDVAKRAGKVRPGKAMARLGRKIHRDIQPTLDKLIALYVGSNPLASQIMSIRDQIKASTGSAVAD